MEFTGHVEFFVLLIILLSCHESSQSVDDVDPSKLWPEGKPIPYEISNQYNSDDSLLIKAALVEIMKSTCIIFVPRTKMEEDYIVFMEYKALSQTRGTCWSGKWKDMGSEFGFQKGRHVISLWRDLGCFNRFNLIYEVLRILGFDTHGSDKKDDNRNIKGNYRSYIHAILLYDYERKRSELNEPTTSLRISWDAGRDLVRSHPYAFDLNSKITKTFVGKNHSNQLDDYVQLLTKDRLSIIRKFYDCTNASDKGVNVSGIGNDATDGNCHDKSYHCKEWSDSGECKKNPAHMLWNCRASCKQCKSVENVRFSDENCRDENKNCSQWAEIGRCKRNPNYMLWNCRASCNRCKSLAQKPDSNCKDENNNCPWWADVGECSRNPAYMLHGCRFSCKQCETGKTDKLDCKDYFSKDCPRWAAIDLCERDPWVAKYCRVSCKKCTKENSSQWTVLEMDKATLFSLPPVSPDCAAEVRQGTCESDPDYMNSICKTTVCENASKCIDKDKANCPSLAYNGDCEKNLEHMDNNCKASCNIKCCADNHPDCGVWASKGHCVLKPAKVLVNCKRSCVNCEICKDKDNECKKKSELGECTKNPNNMTLYCPKSCKICG